MPLESQRKISLLGIALLCTVNVLLYGCSRPAVDQMSIPASSALVERGAMLANGLAACGFCHGIAPQPYSHLAGGREVKDLYGAVKAPNITPSKSGIGGLKDNQVIAAIRGIWPKENDRRSPDVHRGYEWMTSSDAMALVAYLKSVTPVKNEVPMRIVGFTARNTTGLFSKAPLVQGLVPDIPKEDKLQRGKYIVNNLARCTQCHATDPNETSKNPLAPSFVGLANSANRWSQENLVTFVSKGGIKPSGAMVNPSECPTRFFANASAEEAESIASYIRAL